MNTSHPNPKPTSSTPDNTATAPSIPDFSNAEPVGPSHPHPGAAWVPFAEVASRLNFPQWQQAWRDIFTKFISINS